MQPGPEIACAHGVGGSEHERVGRQVAVGDGVQQVPVAARTGIAVALSRPDSLPGVVETELSRIIAGEPAPTITMVGGEAALSANVEAELEALFPGPIAPVASTATSNVPD